MYCLLTQNSPGVVQNSLHIDRLDSTPQGDETRGRHGAPRRFSTEHRGVATCFAWRTNSGIRVERGETSTAICKVQMFSVGVERV